VSGKGPQVSTRGPFSFQLGHSANAMTTAPDAEMKTQTVFPVWPYGTPRKSVAASPVLACAAIVPKGLPRSRPVLFPERNHRAPPP
jgi:hypothetical protein